MVRVHCTVHNCVVNFISSKQNTHRMYAPHIQRYDTIILMGSNHMKLNNPPHCISNRIKPLFFVSFT